MATKDWNSADNIVSSILIPQVITGNGTDTECTGVDGRGFQEVVHEVHVGNSADTLAANLNIQLELEHSDDNSTYTDCTDAQITGAVTGANTGTFALIDAPAEDSAIFSTVYRGPKRYSRVVINLTGNHATGVAMAVKAIRRGPQYLPAIGGEY
jgi:hypothetical protein